VDLHSRSLTFNASADDSLSLLGGLQTLVLGTYPNPTNQLVGPLPSWLGKLAGSLVHLRLIQNKLTGPIDGVKCLQNLNYLDLSANQFSGSIDSVKDLLNLEYLELGLNLLSGPIDVVRGLTELTYLCLYTNPKLNGTINAVANLTKLATLALYGNDFSGKVPSGPIDWSTFSTLDCGMNGNHFSCPLPPGAKENCEATCT
jgi:hypothetical protein